MEAILKGYYEYSKSSPIELGENNIGHPGSRKGDYRVGTKRISMPQKKVIPRATMIKIMLYQLAAFNDEGEDLTEETIHQDVLSDSDGFGAASSKNIYRASIRWVLANNGYDDVKWPAGWISWKVGDLADELLN